jgi:hypothetical protein
VNITELYLRDHARVHSNKVGEAEAGMYLEDIVLGGLTDEQVRARPNGMNSLAWVIFHMARSEDIGVNVLVSGKPQVFDDGWAPRLGLDFTHIGTGMSDDEVAGFTATLNIAELREYRASVGQRTREIVSAMRPEEWDEILGPEAMERMKAAGGIGPNAGWLEGVFGGKSKALIMSHVGTGHNFWHLGEAMTLRSLAGMRLPI